MITTLRETADRPTRLAVLQLSLWGYFLYAFGPSVPLLRDEFGISSGQAGLLSTANAVGAILAGTLGVRMVDRFSRGTMRWVGVALLAVGATTYMTSSGFTMAMVAILIAATGGSLIVNTGNVALLSHHPGARGPMWATWAHALSATVGTISPLVLGLTVAAGAGWRPGFVIVPIAALALGLAMRRERLEGDDLRSTRSERRESLVPLPARFHWVHGALLLSLAAEFCLTLWSTDLVRDRHGLSDAAAAWSFSVLLLGVTIARWMSGGLSLRWGSARLIGAGQVVMVVSLALLLAVPLPAVAFVAMFLVGLGMGPQYPFVIALAIASAGGAVDRAASITSIGIGFTVSIAPYLLGATSDAVGVLGAFLMVPAMVMLSFVLLIVARSRQTA